MGSPVPLIIKNFNLMVDGSGFAGICEEVTLPPLVVHTDDHRGGGMDMPVEIDLGLEKMELKFSMAEHSPVLFRQFGLRSGKAVQATFRAAKSNDDIVQPYVIHCRGRYKDLTPGAIKPGEKSPITGTITLRYYRLMNNNVELIEIDVDNMVRRINGVDVLAELRNAISA